MTVSPFKRINDLDEIFKVMSRPEDFTSDESVPVFVKVNHTAQRH